MFFTKLRVFAPTGSRITHGWYGSGSFKNLRNSSKMVIVTGCDSGIGLELSKMVINWGFHLVACCLQMDSKGAQYLRSRSVTVLQLDVTDEQSVKSVYNQVEEMHQTQNKVVWCLVNNAGVMNYAKTEWLDWQLTKSPLLVNLEGTIQTTRSFLPLLRKNKGRVVNVSSPQGRIASPIMTLYCASKWGVEGFSQGLRRELENQVKVVVVRPYNVPLKTAILKSNELHLKQMWTNMSSITKEDCKDEFETMTKQFESHFSCIEEPEQLGKKHLDRAFRNAITSENPRRSYDAAPMHVRLFFSVVEVLPVWLVDFIVRFNIHIKVIGWA